MIYAAFRSIGAYIPQNIMTNQDFEKIIDTSDEWITKRTGIKERRLANKDEASSDLGAKAALQAISRAGISKEEIDLIVCATCICVSHAGPPARRMKHRPFLIL